MSNDWYQDIVDFHKALEQYIGSKPALPDTTIQKLRSILIAEEVKETLDAIEAGDLVELADGIADSIVVLLGTAVSYGIDLRPVWEAVHRSNMAKVGGTKRADGKALKPEGWTPPDIESEIRRQQSGGKRCQ